MTRTIWCAAILLLARISGPAAEEPFEARRAAAAALLEQGKPREALATALVLNREMPDDLDTYGLLVDAHRALGNRPAALAAAQWMLNLRPTDPRGLARAARLREDTGDLAGAADLLNECYHRTPTVERARRAALLRELARVFKKQGGAEDARQMLQEAERLDKENGSK